ncbi:TetR/AcrR family transcriptional regulator [Niallia sp. NCCP-28]|uniref:TetR/AcrR family transcriptional regulator n=1 Tax=Niallia sp. NCCP-28 TaxID=2934712 RepID=UPI00208612E7|nr:TetR/AcrR family transcriptional regulator [Niallia sp. NCCP-28]GKU83345.1 TetR family transcriptional regulator [Niallia sp. NCCP-28]
MDSLSGKQSAELDTPKLIVQVAYSLFMELGYRAVSTRKIAQTCGITQPALYHHFKNKQEIYVEVLIDAINQIEAALFAIKEKHAEIKERLYRVTCYFMQNYQVDLMQMFHDLQHEMPLEIQKDIEEKWKKGFLRPIINMLDEAIAKGEIAALEKIHTTSHEISLLLLSIIKSAIQPDYLKRMSVLEQQTYITNKARLIVHILLSGIK